MTTDDKWRLVFRKDPSLRFNRHKAYWNYGETYYGFKFYATREQLMEFFADFAGIERSCRTILNDPEFKLPVEADSKRMSKMAEFKKRLSPQDKKDFNKMFGI